ncbi:MAG: hypothetical protein LBI15_02865 [Dysgonamonadaceae bacterium]|jgi:hypothetical protein|nr:hypothetical protein [Dysgonamonadaceae bacterium]
MSDDGLGGCLGTIIGWLIILGVIILLIVYVLVPFLAIVAAIGGVWGGGVSIGNYGKSFIRNTIKK